MSNRNYQNRRERRMRRALIEQFSRGIRSVDSNGDYSDFVEDDEDLISVSNNNNSEANSNNSMDEDAIPSANNTIRAIFGSENPVFSSNRSPRHSSLTSIIDRFVDRQASSSSSNGINQTNSNNSSANNYTNSIINNLFRPSNSSFETSMRSFRQALGMNVLRNSRSNSNNSNASINSNSGAISYSNSNVRTRNNSSEWSRKKKIVDNSALKNLRNLYSEEFLEKVQFPTALNAKKMSSNLFLPELTRVIYRDEKTANEAGLVKSNFLIPPHCGVYYFEVKIINKGQQGVVAVGLTDTHVSYKSLPGWDSNSYGYHGDDGNIFIGNGKGTSYGPIYSTDDTIGCCLNFIDKQCFFTKNGNNIGVAFSDICNNLYVTVGMRHDKTEMKINFGQDPFVFNIEEYIYNCKMDHMLFLQKSCGNDAYLDQAMQQFTLKYMLFNGYLESASAFAQFTGQTYDDSNYRIIKKITGLINDGQIGQSIREIHQNYPNLFLDKPDILFALRIQQYIEKIMRIDLDYVHPHEFLFNICMRYSSGSLNTNNVNSMDTNDKKINSNLDTSTSNINYNDEEALKLTNKSIENEASDIENEQTDNNSRGSILESDRSNSISNINNNPIIADYEDINSINDENNNDNDNDNIIETFPYIENNDDNNESLIQSNNNNSNNNNNDDDNYDHTMEIDNTGNDVQSAPNNNTRKSRNLYKSQILLKNDRNAVNSLESSLTFPNVDLINSYFNTPNTIDTQLAKMSDFDDVKNCDMDQLKELLIFGHLLYQAGTYLINKGLIDANLYDKMMEVFGLIVVKDIENSPLNYLKNPNSRLNLSKSLNSYILEHLDEPPSSNIDILVTQINMCYNKMIEKKIKFAGFLQIGNLF